MRQIYAFCSKAQNLEQKFWCVFPSVYDTTTLMWRGGLRSCWLRRWSDINIFNLCVQWTCLSLWQCQGRKTASGSFLEQKGSPSATTRHLAFTTRHSVQTTPGLVAPRPPRFSSVFGVKRKEGTLGAGFPPFVSTKIVSGSQLSKSLAAALTFQSPTPRGGVRSGRSASRRCFGIRCQ